MHPDSKKITYKIRWASCLIAGGIISAVLSSGTSFAAVNPLAPFEATITNTLAASGVEPLGANIGTVAGGTNFAINNLVKGSGFEPFVIRELQRISFADSGYITWNGDGGVTRWDLFGPGFLNGAEIRFYRLVDAAGNPLPASGSYIDIANAHHVSFLGIDSVRLPSAEFPMGGFVVVTNAKDSTLMKRVYLKRGTLQLKQGDYAFIVLKAKYLGPEAMHARLDSNRWSSGPMNADKKIIKQSLVSHPGVVPGDMVDPGESCLLLDAFANSGGGDFNASATQVIWYPYDTLEGQWYSQLHPGTPYRAEIWMRQEGIKNGQVKFTMNQAYSSLSQQQPWVVTSEWKKYTYDFVGPAYPTTGYHISHGLAFTAPGKLWIDNYVIYENDAKHDYKPFVPHQISMDEIMDAQPSTGKKGAIRFYGLTFNHSSIDRQFTNYGSSNYTADWYAGISTGPDATIAQCMELAYRTGSSPATRVVPMQTCVADYTESEWMALIEYLGVPYNPSTDTPKSKPYAYKRYLQRGNGTPWTDDFREIIIEYGNETWHQGLNGWDGFGQSGYVHQGGKEYGIFAKFMFDQTIKTMPAWNQYSLGSKIKFALGANYSADTTWAYAELAMKQKPSVSYLGHANYVGPKWETGDSGFSSFTDHGLQETSVALLTGMKPLIDQIFTTRDYFKNSRGTPYDIIAYEGGPSGYWQNPKNPKIDELYGKSLSMGLAALDAWLYSSFKGYKYQCYLGFGSGKWWSSHTLPEAGGFRSHCGWLALKMRNKYAIGENMMNVSVSSTPTFKRIAKADTVPLVGIYCLRSERAYSVFILNRKVDGTHDSVNFGDGYTPVTLHLPFSQPGKITVYKMAAPSGAPSDPRWNNIDSLRVAIVSQPVLLANFKKDFIVNSLTGATAKGLPPGAIYLYVFENITDAPALPNGATSVRRRPIPEVEYSPTLNEGNTQEIASVSPNSSDPDYLISLNSLKNNNSNSNSTLPAVKNIPVSGQPPMGAIRHQQQVQDGTVSFLIGNEAPPAQYAPLPLAISPPIASIDYTLSEPTVLHASVDAQYVRATQKPSMQSVIAGRRGFALYEVWSDSTISNVADLIKSPLFGQAPSDSQYIGSFELPASASRDRVERISGYIYPPMSGNYTFIISAGTPACLRLSTDSKKDRVKTIAEISGKYKAASSISKPVFLFANKRYYIELLHSGKDVQTCSVMWAGPGKTNAIIKGSSVSVAQGK